MSETKERFALVMSERADNWEQQASTPEAAMVLMNQYFAWVDALAEQGAFKGGEGLFPEGATVSVVDGQVVDGPFAETKELIAGYFLLESAHREEALGIARSCPALAHNRSLHLLPWCSEPDEESHLLSLPSRDGCFLLLCHASEEASSPQVQQQELMAWLGWVDGVKADGLLRYAEPFAADSVKLWRDGDVLQEAEHRSSLSGIYCIEAESLSAAVELAKTCPSMTLGRAGARIEVQPVWDVNAARM